MRAKILSLCLFLSLLAGANSAFATDYYWVGPNTSPAAVWNNADNWSLTSGGDGTLDAGIPGASDVAIFDSNSQSDCNISTNINVGEIKVLSGYMDWNTFSPLNIYQNAIVAVTKVTLNDGNFAGGTANMLIRESLTIVGGIFQSTSGQLTFQGTSLNFTSGGFVHNGGSILFTSVAGGTNPVTISGSPVFNNVKLSGGGDRDIIFNNAVTVNGNLSIEGSNNLNINTGTINLKGNLICSNTGTTGGGTALINFNGVNQTITGASAVNNCRLPKVAFNNSGILSLANTITFTNDFTNNAASLDAGTSNVIFTNGANSSYTLSGSGTTAFNNLEFNPSVSITCNINPLANISVANNFSYAGTGAVSFSGGAIELNGNAAISNTNTSGTGGTTNFIFNGTADQTITRTSTSFAGLLPAVTINKPTGNLILPAALVVTGNWTYIAGAIDYSTNNNTLTFATNNLTISGTHNLKNVSFKPSSSGTTFTIASGTNILVGGNLTLESGGNINLNTGTISIGGDVLNNNSAVNGGGTATLALTGTANQTLNGRSVNGWGKLPNVVINKPGGTLTLSNRISLGAGSSWTYTAGTVNAGTSAIYINDGGTVFTGSHTLNALTIDPSTSGTHTYSVTPGTTITLNGDLNIAGLTGTEISLNNGEIKANKDVYAFNGGTNTGGTTTITVSGTGAQTIIGNGTAGVGSLPKLKIDKATGSLLITNKATVASELILARGAVNLDNDIFTLGTSASNIGTLTYTGGTLYGGTFSRWYSTGSVADNVNASLFPMGTSSISRPVYVSTIANPTSGGTIAVTYTDGSGTTNADYSEVNGDNIKRYSNAYWNISSNNGLTGGTYYLRSNPGNLLSVSDVNSLRFTVAQTTVGTDGGATGTASNPSIARTGLSLTDLSNDFRIASTEPDASLPVELVAFEAKKVNEKVALTWKTASEQNNDFFVVERSANGKDFSAIAKVKGAGTTAAAQVYNSTDEKPLGGISYYRLVQTDFDGTTSYSKIVAVNFENKAAVGTVASYPNPASDNMEVRVSGVNGNATLEIQDLTGKLMLRKQLSGNEQPTVNVATFPQGLYTIRVYSEKEMAVSKFLKQ